MSHPDDLGHGLGEPRTGTPGLPHATPARRVVPGFPAPPAIMRVTVLSDEAGVVATPACARARMRAPARGAYNRGLPAASAVPTKHPRDRTHPQPRSPRRRR